MVEVAKKPACDCVATIQADLKDRRTNTHVVTELFSAAVVIRTDKVAPRGRKPVTLVASFCPFCGTAYGDKRRPIGAAAPAREAPHA